MSDTFTIRYAELEDIDALTLLDMAIFNNGYNYDYLFDVLFMSTDYNYVAVDDNGKIIGYLLTSVLEMTTGPNEIANYMKENDYDDVLNIWAIGVVEEWRGKGVGRTLLDALIYDVEDNDEVGQVMLQVRLSNSIAIKLYENTNFKKVLVIPTYYTNPDEDAHLMIYLTGSRIALAVSGLARDVSV